MTDRASMPALEELPIDEYRPVGTLQEWTAARAEELPGAHIAYPFGPEFTVFRVRDKMFMAHTVLRSEPIVLLKARPEDGVVLRKAYAQITPGWHMNKRHWITLHPKPQEESARDSAQDAEEPDQSDRPKQQEPPLQLLDRQIIADLVTESYLLVVEKLPRAQRPVDPATFGQPGA